MSPIDLYYMPISPPCRSVMMTAKALGIDLNMKMVNVMEGEHMKPEYLEVNPEHTIPAINDNGLILWESRAIMSYFVNQYGKDDALYPKDPKKRAVVDMRLFFDGLSLYNHVYSYFGPVVMGIENPSEEKRAKVEELLTILNKHLENAKWVAGDFMSIADISIVVTVSTVDAVGFDLSKFENIANWYKQCKNDMADFGYEEINQTGADVIGQLFKTKLN